VLEGVAFDGYQTQNGGFVLESAEQEGAKREGVRMVASPVGLPLSDVEEAYDAGCQTEYYERFTRGSFMIMSSLYCCRRLLLHDLRPSYRFWLHHGQLGRPPHLGQRTQVRALGHAAIAGSLTGGGSGLR
jgi:hypothetical protein